MEKHKERYLGEKVFHKLRNDILTGKYKEHIELREGTIGEELGVSRTPVREALRQLELEGLVEIVPNKGAYVTGISYKDVLEINYIRSYLEGIAAKWAAEKISEKDLEELEETVYLAEYSIQRERPDQVFELDNRFHEVIYRASGSRILNRTLSDYHKYIQQARSFSVHSMERAAKSVEEHKVILEAIRSHNGEEAEKLAIDHIDKVGENLKKQELEQKIGGTENE